MEAVLSLLYRNRKTYIYVGGILHICKLENRSYNDRILLSDISDVLTTRKLNSKVLDFVRRRKSEVKNSREVPEISRVQSIRYLLTQKEVGLYE